MEIRKSPMGVDVSIPFTTDLSNDGHVLVTYSRFGINVAATGSLNPEGVKALRQALDVAEILHEHNYLLDS